MKPSPSISIAMATYNGERFIGEQLESLAKQSVLPAELVVTDDASTDRTLEIVGAFSARAPFVVRTERNPVRLGYRANFLKAAGLCRSDIVAFADQDDVWLPEKLKTCLGLFRDDVMLVYHNATVVNEALGPIGSMDNRGAPQEINRNGSIEPWNFPPGFAQMFRRELLAFTDLWPQSVDYYHPDEKEAHDQWFFFLASCLGSIGYVGQPLALYRQHQGNTFGVRPPGSSKPVRLLRNILEGNADGLRARESCAGRRAAALESLQRRLVEKGSRRAQIAALGYRRLEQSYRLRQELYAPGNPLTKSRQIVSLVRHGAYRPRLQWGVGPKALLRDIVRGVIFPAKGTNENAPDKPAQKSS